MKIMQCGLAMTAVVTKQRIRIESRSHQYLVISKILQRRRLVYTEQINPNSIAMIINIKG